MSQVVYKYEIPPPDSDNVSALKLPARHQLLHVGSQGWRLFVWSLVDPRSPELERRFKVVATGEPFEEWGWRHFATTLMDEGKLVWHVFVYDPPVGATAPGKLA
jgi:hypothetical protein